jgi:hypothetical protein
MRIFLFFILFLASENLVAGKIDKAFLKKITGTKWMLVEEKKPGLFAGKNTQPVQQQVTFSTGIMLFDSDSADQHYQCNYTLKNNSEFWLYCTEPDQYVYKIHSLSNTVLVMDMLVKSKSGKYVKRKRMTFKRKS